MSEAGPIRELSWDERIRWGTCSVCGAVHGTACYAAVGLQLGRKADGSQLRDGEGVHMLRLRAAPQRVREVEA